VSVADALALLVQLIRERGGDLDGLVRNYRLTRELPPDDPLRRAWDDYWNFMDEQGFDGILRQLDAGARPPATRRRGQRGPDARGEKERDLAAITALMGKGVSYIEACALLGLPKNRREYLREWIPNRGKK
jgi:hypothetical protein